MLNCVNQLFVRFNLLFLSILCSKQSILLYLLPFTKLSFMLFVFINYFYHVGDMGGLLLVLPSDVLNFMNNLWCPHLLEHIVHRRNRGQKTFFFVRRSACWCFVGNGALNLDFRHHQTGRMKKEQRPLKIICFGVNAIKTTYSSLLNAFAFKFINIFTWIFTLTFLKRTPGVRS